jgi:hypothetical protein
MHGHGLRTRRYDLSWLRLITGWRCREGEWRYISRLFIGCDNLVGAFPFYFINSNNGLQGNIGALYTGEFRLELLFGRVHYDGGPLSEDNVLDFDKGVHTALVNLAGMKFIDAALVIERDPVNL